MKLFIKINCTLYSVQSIPTHEIVKYSILRNVKQCDLTLRNFNNIMFLYCCRILPDRRKYQSTLFSTYHIIHMTFSYVPKNVNIFYFFRVKKSLIQYTFKVLYNFSGTEVYNSLQKCSPRHLNI